MDYLEELKNRCKKDGKEVVMKQLDISKTYLNNLLDGRKKISKPIQNKIDSIEIFEVKTDSITNKIYKLIVDNEDKVDNQLYEDLVEYINSIKGI
jgi:hypothetical protein